MRLPHSGHKFSLHPPNWGGDFNQEIPTCFLGYYCLLPSWQQFHLMFPKRDRLGLLHSRQNATSRCPAILEVDSNVAFREWRALSSKVLSSSVQHVFAIRWPPWGSKEAVVKSLVAVQWAVRIHFAAVVLRSAFLVVWFRG